MKADTVAHYLYNVAIDAHQSGYTILTVIIDNNSIHKDYMRYQLWLRLHKEHDLNHFCVRFINTPRYSPEFNLAEYIIHQIRRKFLHHMPSRSKMDEICQKIRDSLQKTQLQTKEQIRATINYILQRANVDHIF